MVEYITEEIQIIGYHFLLGFPTYYIYKVQSMIFFLSYWFSYFSVNSYALKL